MEVDWESLTLPLFFSANGSLDSDLLRNGSSITTDGQHVVWFRSRAWEPFLSSSIPVFQPLIVAASSLCNAVCKPLKRLKRAETSVLDGVSPFRFFSRCVFLGGFMLRYAPPWLCLVTSRMKCLRLSVLLLHRILRLCKKCSAEKTAELDGWSLVACSGCLSAHSFCFPG
eukprot:RCo021363